MVALNPVDPAKRCPCGTGLTFGECCGKYHAGALAPTAETLMRSRFTAFVTRDAEYLLATWHPSARPAELNLAAADAPDIRFYRLDILATEAGGPLDGRGVVEFKAFYKGDATGSQRERSTFVKEGGRWFYASGLVE